MPQIRVTMQVANGPETSVFDDDVASERLCPTLSVAENAASGAVGVLQASAVIREYVGIQLVKSVEVGCGCNDAKS